MEPIEMLTTNTMCDKTLQKEILDYTYVFQAVK